MILRMFIFSALVFVSIYTKNAKAVEKSGSVSAATSDVLALDLKDAIAAALENNPDVKAAKSDLDAAAARTDRADAGHWPTLSAQAGWTEYRRNQRLYPAASSGEPAVTTHHLLGADVVLSVPIYAGGRVSKGVEAAKAEETALRETRRWTKAELVFRVTATYYKILAGHQMLAALDGSLATMERNLEQIDALVTERKAAPIDRVRVEVRIAALKQARVQEESTLKVQTLTLLSLIGLDDRKNDVEVKGKLEMPDITPPVSVETLVRDSLQRRADLKTLRARVAVRDRNIDMAKSGHLPQVSLRGSYGIRVGMWPSDHPDGANLAADVGQVGVYLDVPIFNGGLVTAEVREQEAGLSALRERLRQAESVARLEIETAVLGLQASMERVSLSEATIGQATEALRVEAEKYAVGKSSIYDLLSAQTDLLDAKAGRAQALADANIAVAALERSLGENI